MVTSNAGENRSKEFKSNNRNNTERYQNQKDNRPRKNSGKGNNGAGYEARDAKPHFKGQKDSNGNGGFKRDNNRDNNRDNANRDRNNRDGGGFKNRNFVPRDKDKDLDREMRQY